MENGIAAGARGSIPMLVEKPMDAMRSKRGTAADAIRRAGVFASVCFPNRYLDLGCVSRIVAHDALRER
ncbi:MAG: hypothetical protein IPI73_30930 [Betaproteobacteria bacterium]|nr:hypothetical protein [Betaproteobacteria bacterium]